MLKPYTPTMQSIFRLPWCSDPIATKSEHVILEKMRASPVVEIPSLNKLKRKRTNSSDVSPLRAHDNKKLRPAHYESQMQFSKFQPSAKPELVETPVQTLETASAPTSTITPADVEPMQPLSVVAMSTPASLRSLVKPMDSFMDGALPAVQVPASEDVKSFTPLQQVIENEFNMQILMKHNELRLIDQELAKCQIALEQLRRCEVRPYPGSERPSEAVSSGTGPAITPLAGHTRPRYPAPHGVTDGPYSRHYKQWLLHDPQFDSMPVQLLQPDAGRTRNNGPTSRRSVGQPFAFPTRSDRLPAIPNYPALAPSKDRNLPNVLRRSTDNQLVKLICNHCQRGNFSSIQGFLNHCRIAHKVDYKSHDAAAIDCGQPLEEGEAAMLPLETQHTPAPKPTVTRAPTASATSSSTPHRSYVHPFNTSTGGTITLGHPRKPIAPRQPVKPVSSVASPAASSPFHPSAQLPRLSAHFAKHHVGGNLAKAAADAKQRVDFSFEDNLRSPDISEQNSPSATPAGSRTFATGGTLSVNSGSIPRPSSRKGVRQLMPQSKARPSPLAPMPNNHPTIKHEHSESPDTPNSHDLSLDLSPHTADSNPGLVSDHEDDDHGSASESEEGPAPHSPASRPLAVPGNRNCGENMELDVAVEVDEIDSDGLIIRRNSLSGEGRKFGAPGKRGV